MRLLSRFRGFSTLGLRPDQHLGSGNLPYRPLPGQGILFFLITYDIIPFDHMNPLSTILVVSIIVTCALIAPLFITIPEFQRVGREYIVTPTASPRGSEVSSAPSGKLETDSTTIWATYTNRKFQYSIMYPRTIVIKGDENSALAELDKQITIEVSPSNPEDCQGDCPVIEVGSNIHAGRWTARKLGGYLGKVGGNIPQNYESVVINKNGLYYIFTVYELPSDSEAPHNRSLGHIPEQKIELLNHILVTLRWTR